MVVIPPPPRTPVRRSHVVLTVAGGLSVALAALVFLLGPLAILSAVDLDAAQVADWGVYGDFSGVETGLIRTAIVWVVAFLLFVVGVILLVVGIMGMVQRPGRRWAFNPPPGWAPATPGWAPRDPVYMPQGTPVPPEGWQFWVPLT